MLNKKEIDDILSKIEKEDSMFAKKASIDSLCIPSSIIGRTKPLIYRRISEMSTELENTACHIQD